MSKKLKINGTGTKEWADSNVNIAYGCSHDCMYCYAKKMAIRFKRETEQSWSEMKINEEAVEKGYGKRKGRIMFPTSHDITPRILDECVIVLKKMLLAGNEVLITTKPNLECMMRFKYELKNFQHLIQFRFTITTHPNNKEIREFWEPGAPSINDRCYAIAWAKKWGFKTSISCEPYLSDPEPIYDFLGKYCTESFWIGKMNYIAKDTPEPWQSRIREITTDEYVLDLYERMKDLPKVRWKDSIKKVLNRKRRNF